jgi:hypothetical protein
MIFSLLHSMLVQLALALSVVRLIILSLTVLSSPAFAKIPPPVVSFLIYFVLRRVEVVPTPRLM